MPGPSAYLLAVGVALEAAAFLWVVYRSRSRWYPGLRGWWRDSRTALSRFNGAQVTLAVVAAVAIAAAILVGSEYQEGKVGVSGLLAIAAVASLLLLGMTALVVVFQLDMAADTAGNEKLIVERLEEVVKLLDAHLPQVKGPESPQTPRAAPPAPGEENRPGELRKNRTE